MTIHMPARLRNMGLNTCSEAADRIIELERQNADLEPLRAQNQHLVALYDAVANLIKVKGRHNTEIAYQRLVAAFDVARDDTAAPHQQSDDKEGA